jgi:4-amino-4-deoxy-L-arabinose transferase-like glycosyltransferase
MCRDRKTLLRRPMAQFVLAWAVALGLFLLVNRNPGLREGFDYFCSGHLMLLASSYLHADFATPLMMPTEDPYGPVDTWAPYFGWPPLFALSLAAFLKAFGSSLAAARFYACLWSSASAALVFAIGRRMTGSLYFAWLGFLAYLSSNYVVKFCGFVCNDTAALTCCLAMIATFPGTVTGRNRWKIVIYCLGTALAGLMSWQCFVAPVACGLALAVTRPRLFKRRWGRVVAPTLTAMVVGAGLLTTLSWVGSHYEPNYWMNRDRDVSMSSRSLLGKFLHYTGYHDPGWVLLEAKHHFVRSFDQPALLMAIVILSGFGAVGLVGVAQSREGTGSWNSHARGIRYCFLVLWLLPIAWLLFMPGMHFHEFQAIFTAPGLCLSGILVLRATWPVLPHAAARAWYERAIVALFVGFVAMNAVRYRWFEEPPRCFRDLVAAVRSLTKPETLVVMGIDQRGVWWECERPIISTARIHRAQERDHILVLPQNASGWEDRYEVLWNSPPIAAGQLQHRFVILRPKKSGGDSGS